MKKKILMVVYGPIQFDARVQRSAEILSGVSSSIILISCNSNVNYTNLNFISKVYTNKKMKRFFLTFSFWLYIIQYAYKNRNKFDILYIHDFPIALPGLIIAKLCNKVFIYDSHELLLQRKNYHISIGRKAFILWEKWAMKGADLVIAANYERERIIRNIFKLRNTIHINNIISHVNEQFDKQPLKENAIVYQGYLSSDRDLSNLLRWHKYLPNNIILKIIGNGEMLEKYEQIVVDQNLNNIKFTGKLNYDALIEESSKCKIGIILYSMDNLNNYYCAPNKIYEYAALRMPMLVSPQPFLVNVVKKYHIGEVLRDDISTEEYKTTILNMINNYDKYVEGLNCFLADYSFEYEKKKLCTAFNELLLIEK